MTHWKKVPTFQNAILKLRTWTPHYHGVHKCSQPSFRYSIQIFQTLECILLYITCITCVTFDLHCTTGNKVRVEVILVSIAVNRP